MKKYPKLSIEVHFEKAAETAVFSAMGVLESGKGVQKRNRGPVRLVCSEKPGRVLCNEAEAIHPLKEESTVSSLGTYLTGLSPRKGNAVLEVLWDCSD